MIQVIQLIDLAQLVELGLLLHGILHGCAQLLVMRLMSRMGCLMCRGEGGHRERDEQHRAAEDVRTTSTHCARLLPTPFVDFFVLFLTSLNCRLMFCFSMFTLLYLILI